MLYHAILQLNQKAKQTKRAIHQLNTLPNKQRHSGKKTKKAQTQLAFNKQNTINRRNDFKKLVAQK